MHRFDLQGTHAFVSTEWAGFRSNILAILDLADPRRPSLLGRWWLPGKEEAEGGAAPAGDHHWVHLALARGNRAYAACGRAGAVIVDVSDPRHPATVGGAAWNPPYTCPTHTFLPVPHPIRNRRFAVVTDEDVTDQVLEDPPAFMWVLDITHEQRPVPVATYQVDPAGLAAPGRRFGAHQPWEHVREDNLVFLAWFAGGVRAVDLSDSVRAPRGRLLRPPASARTARAPDQRPLRGPPRPRLRDRPVPRAHDPRVRSLRRAPRGSRVTWRPRGERTHGGGCRTSQCWVRGVATERPALIPAAILDGTLEGHGATTHAAGTVTVNRPTRGTPTRTGTTPR